MAYIQERAYSASMRHVTVVQQPVSPDWMLLRTVSSVMSSVSSLVTELAFMPAFENVFLRHLAFLMRYIKRLGGELS